DLALALEHADGHRGLVVVGRREGLALLGRDRRVALDQAGGHARQRLDAGRPRRPAEQQVLPDPALQPGRQARTADRRHRAGGGGAPTATTSSGLTLRAGSLPTNCFTTSMTLGMRVMPPTRITSSIWPACMPASLSAALQGSRVRWIRSSTSDSSLARDSLITRCLGPLASAVMNGRLISVSLALESSILAFSAASLRRCSASLSLRRSMPWSFLNSSAR